MITCSKCNTSNEGGLFCKNCFADLGKASVQSNTSMPSLFKLEQQIQKTVQSELKLPAKIILKQKGEEACLPLKNLHTTLTWTSDIDLDLYAYYKTKNNDEGCVSFCDEGSLTSFPYIFLDQDAGVGDVGGDNEENLYINDLSQHEHILIAVNIFNKPMARFSDYDGLITIKSEGKTYEVPLTATERGSYCIIAHIDNSEFSPKLININKVQDTEPEIENFLEKNIS